MKGGLLKAHLFLLIIFFVVIFIEVVIPMKNTQVLLDITFYINFFKSPLIWILYVSVILAFTGKRILKLVLEKRT